MEVKKITAWQAGIKLFDSEEEALSYAQTLTLEAALDTLLSSEFYSPEYISKLFKELPADQQEALVGFFNSLLFIPLKGARK